MVSNAALASAVVSTEKYLTVLDLYSLLVHEYDITANAATIVDLIIFVFFIFLPMIFPRCAIIGLHYTCAAVVCGAI